MNTPIKLYTAKEIIALFRERNVTIGKNTAHAIIRDCSKTIRRRYITFEDAWATWSNPLWSPSRKDGGNGIVQKW